MAVKGAPEAVLEACTHVLAAEGKKEMTGDLRQAWSERNEHLALATKTADAVEAEPYQKLTWLGLVGREFI